MRVEEARELYEDAKRMEDGGIPNLEDLMKGIQSVIQEILLGVYAGRKTVTSNKCEAIDALRELGFTVEPFFENHIEISGWCERGNGR